MIMDWVLLDGTPIQVAGLHNRKVGVHKRRRSIYCSWHSDGEFRPIPLTEEILVKNGFKRHPLWHHCTLETDDGSKIYIPLACGGGIEYVSIYKHFEDLTVRDIDIQIPIHYVHQLQHLLRLCGIEKEIEL